MRLLAGVAGLALAVLHVGRHPATRRLSEDAVDACEYCERLTRDWETIRHPHKVNRNPPAALEQGVPEGWTALSTRLVSHVAPIVRTYLGNDTMQGHSIILSLAGRNLNVSEYISGQWHHDRCAKRVKCFLFLDAVDADSHPMKLIRGTHDNVYYSYKERSFEPAFARAQGEEVSLTGGAGDGYCFDTNSIHAGELSGRKARYVVVMEFHSGIIEDAFSRHGLHFRSPFGLR